MYDLTGFQRDLLYTIAGQDDPHGLAIKEELEDYYEKEIHHGRLYPTSTKSSTRASSRRANSTSERTTTRSPLGAGANSRLVESGKTSTSASCFPNRSDRTSQ